MRKVSVIGLLLLMCVVGCSGGSYHFSVPLNESAVYINSDGSLDVEYRIVFKNKGKPIDIVDIGLPHPQYRLETARAELRYPDGRSFRLATIRVSTYIEVGVEVPLTGCEIPKGEQAEFYFRVNVPNMVFKDDVDSNYASVNFVPTWFAPELVSGKTHLIVRFYFPEGVKEDEARYHGADNAPQEMGFKENRFAYTWVVERAEQKPYKFGVSFPKRFVGKVDDSWRYDRKWLTGGARKGDASSAGDGIKAMVSSLLVFGVWCLGIAAVVASFFHKKKLRRRYIEPTIGVEGMGERKGLRPCEAAVVLELPAEQIIGIAILELVEEGIVKINSVSPLKVEVLKDVSQLEGYRKKLVEAMGAAGDSK
ncbi:MAG: hypothetical protein N2234_10890, partial [Planctomycetota bacterium]|nr:hypothetical protein [Planctomycetota bacterium]